MMRHEEILRLTWNNVHVDRKFWHSAEDEERASAQCAAIVSRRSAVCAARIILTVGALSLWKPERSAFISEKPSRQSRSYVTYLDFKTRSKNHLACV
jgi:hypothetical protein